MDPSPQSVESVAVHLSESIGGGTHENEASKRCFALNSEPLFLKLVAGCTRLVAKHRCGAGYGRLRMAELEGGDLAMKVVESLYEGNRKYTAETPDDLLRQFMKSAESIVLNTLKKKSHRETEMPDESSAPAALGTDFKFDGVILDVDLEELLRDEAEVLWYVRLRILYGNDHGAIAQEMNILEKDVPSLHKKAQRRLRPFLDDLERSGEIR